MFKRSSRPVATLCACILMGYATGGCGTTATPDNLASGALDPETKTAGALVAEGSGPSPEDQNTTTNPDDASDSPLTENTVASEATLLADELQTLVGTPDADFAGAALDALLLALADSGNSAADSPIPVLASLIQTFRELRTEVRQLRQTLTRAQAAQLLLNALVAGDTSAADTGSPILDLLAQAQSLLVALRSTSVEPTAPVDELVTP